MKQGKTAGRHVHHPIYRTFKNEQYGSLHGNFTKILKGQVLLLAVLLLVEVFFIPSVYGFITLLITAVFILAGIILRLRTPEFLKKYQTLLHGAVCLGLSAGTAACFLTAAVEMPEQYLRQVLLLTFYMLVMGLTFLTGFPLRLLFTLIPAIPLLPTAVYLGLHSGFDSFSFLSLLFPLVGWGLLAISAGFVEKFYYREFRMRSIAESRRRKVTEELDRVERLNAELREIRSTLEKEIEERKLVEKNLEQVAAFDELTAVYNRRAGVEVLKEALHYSVRKQSPLTIAFVDLDRLKIVNDNFGHSVGDNYLREVVSLLRKHLRKSDSLSRYGGDEFLVVLPDCSEDEARSIFDRVEEDMRQMNSLERQYPVSFSYGFAEADLENELEYRRLISMADDRMYMNKQKKKFSGGT